MNVSNDIQHAICQIAEKYSDISKITLFGSRARCDNSERSDIDLAVYFHDNKQCSIDSDLDKIHTLLKFDVTYMHGQLDKAFLDRLKNEEVVIYMGQYENKLANFKKAVDKLGQVVNMPALTDDIVRDSLIQRFEFCYELAWKTLKDYLQYNGLTVESMPRPVFKAAFEHSIIGDEKIWLQMMKDRNVYSHEYNEQYIINVAKRVISDYYPAYIGLIAKIEYLLSHYTKPSPTA